MYVPILGIAPPEAGDSLLDEVVQEHGNTVVVTTAGGDNSGNVPVICNHGNPQALGNSWDFDLLSSNSLL